PTGPTRSPRRSHASMPIAGGCSRVLPSRARSTRRARTVPSSPWVPPTATDQIVSMTPTSETHAVVLSDRTGRILYWSPGAERLFGHPATEALGQSLDLIVPDAFRARQWARFHRAMASGVFRLRLDDEPPRQVSRR